MKCLEIKKIVVIIYFVWKNGCMLAVQNKDFSLGQRLR